MIESSSESFEIISGIFMSIMLVFFIIFLIHKICCIIILNYARQFFRHQAIDDEDHDVLMNAAPGG